MTFGQLGIHCRMDASGRITGIPPETWLFGPEGFSVSKYDVLGLRGPLRTSSGALPAGSISCLSACCKHVGRPAEFVLMVLNESSMDQPKVFLKLGQVQ